MTTLTGYAKLHGTLIRKDVTVDFRDRAAGGVSVLDSFTGRALGVVIDSGGGFVAAPSANAFKMNACDEVPSFLHKSLPGLFITRDDAAAALICQLLSSRAPALGFEAHLDVVPAQEIAAYAA